MFFNLLSTICIVGLLFDMGTAKDRCCLTDMCLYLVRNLYKIENNVVILLLVNT